jgi:hypothetical protein
MPFNVVFGLRQGFDQEAVLAWLGAAPGLTVVQRAATATRMAAEEDFDGEELATITTKRLVKLVRGTAAEEAVPQLLAARDARLAAEAASAAPGCPVCLEPYSAVGGVVPRMLVSCGHDFCEGCLDRMLRCATVHHRLSWRFKYYHKLCRSANVPQR